MKIILLLLITLGSLSLFAEDPTQGMLSGGISPPQTTEAWSQHCFPGTCKGNSNAEAVSLTGTFTGQTPL